MCAVIGVSMDYDYCDGVKCIKTFLTQEQANQHKEILEEKRLQYNHIYERYNKDFVNSLDLDNFKDHSGWKKEQEYKNLNQTLQISERSQQELAANQGLSLEEWRKQIENDRTKRTQKGFEHYCINHRWEIKDYCPPEGPKDCGYDLFVVEIN